MIELTVMTQVLGIIALMLLIGVLAYLFFMLGKINKKLDSILEMITYYERTRDALIAFSEGPFSVYLDIAKSVFSFISPLLTKGSNTK